MCTGTLHNWFARCQHWFIYTNLTRIVTINCVTIVANILLQVKFTIVMSYQVTGLIVNITGVVRPGS